VTPTSILPAAGWPELLSELGRGTVLVVGAPGTGKTALARYLVGQLDRVLRRVGLVDCDPGRPAVGVPGCLGLALTSPWEAPAALWFVGGSSPADHPLPSVVGAARLAERARAAGAEAVVLDTPGRVGDAGGRALLYHLAQATGADLVVAIERGDELAPLLTLLAHEGRRIHRLAPSPAARPRSEDEAEARRGDRLRAHLHDTSTRLFGAGRLVHDWAARLPPDGRVAGHNGNGGGPPPPVPGTPPPATPLPGPVLPGTVVGLLDRAGFCLGLGRVEEIHADRVAVATRVASREVASLRVGGFRLDEDGSPL
jgi:polynucleotide 5'-kinase involved in rRNA processing